MTRTISILLVALLSIAALVSGAETSKEGRSPDRRETLLAWWNQNGLPPTAYLLSKFDDHDWIFVGEYHRIRDDVELVGQMIPKLHRRTRVRHLALEFPCRDSTGEANELITAERFDRGGAIDFYRRQFADWGYEEYLDLFRTAWESNRAFASDRGPFRFVGLNPCVDDEVINYGDDPEGVERERGNRERYDEIMAGVLEERVLKPEHPALVYLGIAHATAKFPEFRFGTDDQLVRMGNMVYREPWTERMFFVALHAPFWDAGREKEIYPFDGILDRLMLEYRAPIGFDVVGGPFAELTHEHRSKLAITHFRFGELYDGYIMHETPLKETVGVTCIPDWIETEEEFRQFWRNLGNKKASEQISRIPLEEFLRDRCAPRPDHGLLFRRRFRRLPDLDSPNGGRDHGTEEAEAQAPGGQGPSGR